MELPTTLEDIQQLANKGEQFDFLFFWGHHAKSDDEIDKSCLSQWYPASFEVDGIIYPTAEHWMMAEKARLFNDEDTLKKIIASETPSMAKALGRKVGDFDETVWNSSCFEIVLKGNHKKFQQNDRLHEFLASTQGKILVEASPYDRIWGIGMRQTDNRAKNPSEWRGTNLLGFALIIVRSQLI